jgi:hypothetical protein
MTKRDRTTFSEGEIVDLTQEEAGNENAALNTVPSLSETCYAYQVIKTCCPEVQPSLLLVGMQYFIRSKDIFTEEHLRNWIREPHQTGKISIHRPRSLLEVDALVDFFIFCDIASKVFGMDDSFDCEACCTHVFRFFSPMDISKRQFKLLSLGLHYSFDQPGPATECA